MILVIIAPPLRLLAVMLSWLGQVVAPSCLQPCGRIFAEQAGNHLRTHANQSNVDAADPLIAVC